MPGYLVQVGAQVVCAHAGQANPVTPNPRVKINGQATVLTSSLYSVAGCTMPSPPNGNGPCATGQWLSGTTRVTSNNQPLVVQSGSSLCTPTGTPLQVISTQTRVKAI